jgi:hypothetical protein
MEIICYEKETDNERKSLEHHRRLAGGLAFSVLLRRISFSSRNADTRYIEK